MTDRSTNETTLRGLIDVFWNAHRLDRFSEFFTDHFVFHSGKADYAGYAGMCDEFATPFLVAFPDVHHEIVYLLIDGDMAAMRYHGTGTLRQDYGGISAADQKLDYHGTVIFRLVDGRIAEAWGHSDLAERIAAQ